VYAALPATMASHFGADGRPNGFMSRDQFFGSFAAFGGGAVLLLLAIPWLARAVPPSLINIPNRAYWLAPERIARVHEKLGAWSAWYAAGMTAFMVAVLELVLRANLARRPLDNAPMVALIALVFAGSGVSIVALVRSFRVPEGDRG
jgi:serine/threonine-protein kinase